MPEKGARNQALLEGKPRYFTGVPCKHGHVEERYADSGECIECARLKQLGRKEYKKEWMQKNRAKLLEQKKNDYRRNKAKFIKRAAAWAKAHPDKARDAARKSGRKWRARNTARMRAHSNARKKLYRHATPRWADKGAIRAIYIECQKRTATEGTPYHVDHVIPLRHKLVCGLHVENNLQILSGSENIRKKNTFKV